MPDPGPHAVRSQHHVHILFPTENGEFFVDSWLAIIFNPSFPYRFWQAASATESLAVILIGCAISVPAIAAYRVYSYRVFWGKARERAYA